MPYVIYKCAISANGYLDDGSKQRLMLSNKQDLAARNAVRRAVDAVVVGAQTVRHDNPLLTDARLKVVITKSGLLSPKLRIFKNGLCIVYKSSGSPAALKKILGDLAKKGVKKLMLEGGGKLGSAFLQQNLVNELQVSVAPFFVGAPNATKFASPGAYPFSPPRRMRLAAVKKVGDMAVLTWKLVPQT